MAEGAWGGPALLGHAPGEVPPSPPPADIDSPGGDGRSRERGGRPRVLLTTEGTYPHVVGGVSTWCHSLVESLEDIDFTVMALMSSPFMPQPYDLPANARLVAVPIWGVEEHAEFRTDLSPRRAIGMVGRVSERIARQQAAPLLRDLLVQVVDPATFSPERFGATLTELYRFFQDHDYRAAWRTRAVWETFRDVFLDGPGGGGPQEDPEQAPTPHEIVQRLGELRRLRLVGGEPAAPGAGAGPLLHDVTEFARVMYRLLTPLQHPIPDADVVHATAAGFCALPGIVKKHLDGTPLLVTEHGVYLREQLLFFGRVGFPQHLRRALVHLVEAVVRTAYHFADQISPVCRYNARWEHAHGATPEQVKVIYNGTDPALFGPREVERPAEPTVVMMARLDPLKDVATSLRVAAAVRQAEPAVRFRYFGPEPDPDYAREMRALWLELGLQDTWQWMGPTKDPAAAFNQGDVVLLTSKSEAFPYTVIEAMMSGRPVVATDVGGVAEAVGDTARTARIGDVEALAQQVLHFLRIDDAERERVSAACRRRALDLFTLSEAMERYRRSYRRLGGADHLRLVIDLDRGPAQALSLNEERNPAPGANSPA